MYILLRWLIMTLAVMLAAWLIPGVSITGVWSAFWLAAFLGILNAIVRPILILLTLPITILTLGLFTLVINAALVLLASTVIRGFDPGGFWLAMLFSVVLAFISYLLNRLLLDPAERR